VAKPGFLISFSAVRAQALPVHRVHDFAEELQRQVERQGWGTVENPDTATDVVEVTVATPRALGDVAGAIKRALRRENLLAKAVVTRRASPRRRPEE
jgi:hypothetical protein